MTTIKYRKKKYEENDIITAHYAICSNNEIVISTVKENKFNKEIISTVYHNFKNKKEYTENLNKIKGNEDYMITKHEYNRLFKEFKNQFTNNCFI